MGTLTSRAERALLGAMLRDPGLAGDLDYVEPGDFELPRHRVLYTAIRDTAAAWDGTTLWLHAKASLTGDGTATLEDLDELTAACPDPLHGRSYAALVLEASFQRAMAGAAGDAGELAESIGYDTGRLAQARSPAAFPAAGLGGHAGMAAAVIRQHAERFDPGRTYAPVGPDYPAAGRQGRDEELILTALVRGHPAAPQILAVVGPAAFTDPLHREVFAAARAADAAGHSLDWLTVDWELARARARHGDQGRATASDYDEPSYTMKLSVGWLAEDIMPAARALARRAPARAAAPGGSRPAHDPGPGQSPHQMTSPQTPPGASRLLQPPPEMNGGGPAPGPRR